MPYKDRILPKFGETKVCPKCGSYRYYFDMKYKTYESFFESTNNGAEVVVTCTKTDEWMELTCDRCGYVVLEETADNDER